MSSKQQAQWCELKYYNQVQHDVGNIQYQVKEAADVNHCTEVDQVRRKVCDVGRQVLLQAELRITCRER